MSVELWAWAGWASVSAAARAARGSLFFIVSTGPGAGAYCAGSGDDNRRLREVAARDAHDLVPKGIAALTFARKANQAINLAHHVRRAIGNVRAREMKIFS